MISLLENGKSSVSPSAIGEKVFYRKNQKMLKKISKL
jgi:hypothetical protein